MSYSNLIWLVPLLPLAGFLVNGLFRRSLSKGMAGLIGCGVIFAAFVLSLLIFNEVRASGQAQPHIVNLFDFIHLKTLSISFGFQVDQLSSIFLLIITGVGFLIHVYSTSYMHEEEGHHFARYFAYLNLFVFSMLLLVLGSNFVIMFMGWEGVGLCSYLLIGYWFRNKEYGKAARKAFIMNRIGDLAFLIALFWLIAKLDTLDFTQVFSRVNELGASDITIITLLLFIGATGKSAQIPLYTWLPDAMAGPTPVSALIHAATMVTAGVYMIVRSNALFSAAPFTSEIIAIIGLSTALLTGTIALFQNDIKKVLAYSTVSQLGFMFLACGVGAYSSGIFHLTTHAFFKALLFLGAGSVIHAMSGEQDIVKMGGLRKKLPVTFITFTIGVLAIAGFPFTSGFVSKDEILLATYSHSKIYFYLAAAGAIITAFYMFRLWMLVFNGSFRGTEEQAHHVHESPAPMKWPLIILAVLSVVGGLIQLPHVFGGHPYLNEFLSAVVPNVENNDPGLATREWVLLGATAVGLIIIYLATRKAYAVKSFDGAYSGWKKVLADKYYVDELYKGLIIRPLKALGTFLTNVVEKQVIDWIVNGAGKTVQYGSRQLRLLQSGQVGSYILLMVAGIILLFVIQFFLRK